MSSLHNFNRTGRKIVDLLQTFFLPEQGIDPPSNSNTKTIGGAERDRTADPLLAKQVLSQLSYSPIFRFRHQPEVNGPCITMHAFKLPSSPQIANQNMVGPGRLELPTSRLSGVRSNHLSYGPNPGRTHDLSSTARSSSLSLEERET